MLLILKTLSADQMRLIASISFNFVSKIPSLLMIIYILPSISSTLGTSLYGDFLAMLALGSTSALFFGGINVVSRRRIAAAYASGDRAGETAAVTDAIACAAIIFLLAASIALIVAAQSASAYSLVLVSIFPVVASFTNVLDNIRAAYNQHYVTAILQGMTQGLTYGAVLYFGMPPGSVVVSALVIQLPFVLASIFGFIDLLRHRPIRIVRRSRPELGSLLRSASLVTLSDGVIFATMNASIYGLGVAGATDTVAWYGTLTRTFQTLLSPVLMIMLPLSSFISLRWTEWQTYTRISAMNLIFAVSIIYGGAVMTAIDIGTRPYFGTLFKSLPQPSTIELVCVGLLFGAVVAQKIYSQLVYSISEARSLSFGTFIIAATATIGALMSLRWLSASQSLSLFGVGLGGPLIILIILHYIGRRRSVLNSWVAND